MAQEVRVPDIGDFDDVSVIEVLVAVGDRVAAEQSLITLESDKASMEIPSPHAGVVEAVKVALGDSVAQGDVIAVLAVDEAVDSADGDDAGTEDPPEDDAPGGDDHTAPPADAAAVAVDASPAGGDGDDRPTGSASAGAVDGAYASPSVRKLARELGVDLGRIAGSGRKGRITRDDLTGQVKRTMGAGGGALPPMPGVDWSAFGETLEVPLSRIRQRAAENLHRSWLHVPHVTQHEDADVTDLEAFRKDHNERVGKRGNGTKLTPVPFVLKAVAKALETFPDVNASLGTGGDTLIRKRYVHLGVAVDTDDGLLVPVIRDVGEKGLETLAAELSEIAARARARKLTPGDLRGATFTVSSLGGIGGTAFTPIVNAPQVAILGVSRAATRPVWADGAFVPRLILPLSLSYDHRVVDGAMAARFIVHLTDLLDDLRRLLL